jgi:dTDP-4-dehydrorhamnose reductase
MKILVTGASGLLGRSLMVSLAPLAPEGLAGWARSRAVPPLAAVDLTDRESVRAAFLRACSGSAPDLVVHAAAERRPDAVDGDPAAAEALNVGATRDLAALAAEAGARLVYVSTDYVFDGSAPPYFPDSAPNPLNAYGRMKLAGELAVRNAFGADADLWAVIRIPILYGRVESLGESPVTELAARLLDGKPFKAEDWATRYPAHADDVARAVAAVARSLAAGEGGVFHFAGAEALTKYGMARAMAEALGLDPALVSPDPAPPAGAPRPRDCRLDGSRLGALGFAPEIGFRAGAAAALKPFVGR